MMGYTRTSEGIDARSKRGTVTRLRVVAVAIAMAFVLASPAAARIPRKPAPAPPSPVAAAPSPHFITVCVNGNVLVDGGFEATDPVTLLNPNYAVTSTLFPSSLCNLANVNCQGGEGPRSGSSWAWFGGNDVDNNTAEIDSAAQTVTFPSSASSVTLQFSMRIGFVTAPFTDTLEVQVDGVTQQTYVEPSAAQSSYTLHTVDLTAFADGAAHVVKFLYTQKDMAGVPNRADFNVDDVSVNVACGSSNPWQDGGFEATNPSTLLNPYYVVFSNLFASSLCNLANVTCQDGEGPHNGTSWAWFGGSEGSGVTEIDTAEQAVKFPAGATSVTLNFYLEIGRVTAPFTDTLEVQVDGVTQQTYTEPSTAEANYTLRSIDLTAFADGASHAVKFVYTQQASASPNRSDFNVDDVTLDVVAGPLVPTALAVDAGGNGVLEPGEVATLQPTWKNTGALIPSLTGSTSSFDGPPVATYDNPDSSGAYGALGTGQSAQCSDCYTVQVTAASRPVTHWDATIQEAAGAVTQTWTLHIGDSFTDVPHDPYYKFIETIFHNHVTGGCGNGTVFCPDDSTLRYQMTVFVLVAKEGPSYVPPPCTPPGAFSDVPCPGGPAVDWIEEAHARGIVSGYPDGTFGPFDPVSRAQMAVFLLATAGITPTPCTPPGIFSDVPCPGGYTNFVETLYTLGITAGCPGPTLQYCPNDPTKRNQMAVFLTTTFHLVLYGP